jgi:DNA-binding response OmpR family regulator
MPQVNDNPLSALLIGEFATDRLLVHDIFRSHGWRLFEAHDRRHALEFLGRHPLQVVIAESELPAWNWKRILSDLRRMAPSPQLVVTSRTADDYLWAEVLNVGGYDVLPQPLLRDEVERVVASARRHYDVQLRKDIRAVISAPAAITA